MENDMSRYHCGSSGKIKGNVPFSGKIKGNVPFSESASVAQATKDF